MTQMAFCVPPFTSSAAAREYGSNSNNNLVFLRILSHCWEEAWDKAIQFRISTTKSGELSLVLGEWVWPLQLYIVEDLAFIVPCGSSLWYRSYLGFSVTCSAHTLPQAATQACLALLSWQFRLLCSSLLPRLSWAVATGQFGAKTPQRIYSDHERKRQNLRIVSAEGEQCCSRKELANSL